MEKVFRRIVVSGSLLFVSTVASRVVPSLLYILLSFIFFLSLATDLVVAPLAGWLRWRKTSKFWPMPTFVCLALLLCSFYGASPVGQFISDRLFERHLGEYARVANAFRDGSLHCESACYGDLTKIEVASLPKHIGSVWAAHCDGESVIVLFQRDSGVPLLHEGYMFRDDETSHECNRQFGASQSFLSELSYVRPIQGHWYRFSDQPGF